MTKFLDDLASADEKATIEVVPTYPIAQWHNGRAELEQLGGVAYTGGVVLPLEYLDDAEAKPAQGWTRVKSFRFKNKPKDVLTTSTLAIAVVRTRFRWKAKVNGQTVYYPRSLPHKQGMRGNLQLLGAIYGYSFPIVVSFTGVPSQRMDKFLGDFASTVLTAAQQRVQKRVPFSAFYMKIIPGPHEAVGKNGDQSTITPPKLQLPPPAELTDDYLDKIYVGPQKRKELRELYYASASWAAQWDNMGVNPENLPAEAEGEED